MARAFHNRFGSPRCFQFATNPLAVFGTGRGLRRYLLDEKTIGRSGGYASGGRMRLIKIALFFKISHHVADGCGTQWFDVAARYASRGDGFTRFDVRADHIGEDLLVPLLL